jgi:3-phosphoshikimate 1-carboxyvinyltransferase
MAENSTNGIYIPPVLAPFDVSVTPPGSKSITNRALALAAVAGGRSVLSGVLFADDTLRMIDALHALGITAIVNEPEHRVTVEGSGGRFADITADIFCQNAGTAIRFLTALCAASTGRYRLDGNARMRQRPIGELASAISTLGGHVNFEMADGYPPLTTGGGLTGGVCRFEQVKSSQFISAILMAGPLANADVEVELRGAVTSEPYVRMTLEIMRRFGVRPVMLPGLTEDIRLIRIAAPATYVGCEFAVEPDASNASYFLAAAAVTPGSRVTIPGLGRESLQGDVLFADVLRQMGAELFMDQASMQITGPKRLGGLTIDMNTIPDMVQTLAVVALFADSPTRIVNVPNLRLKETDRLAALDTELRKLGARVHTTVDSIEIYPAESYQPAAIDTYDDHRMAMAFAVAGMRIKGVRINDPQCTAKTYPAFFTDFLAAVNGRNP